MKLSQIKNLYQKRKITDHNILLLLFAVCFSYYSNEFNFMFSLNW